MSAAVATHPGTEISLIEGVETGPGGGKIIFENDRVRIWDLELDPGQKSAVNTAKKHWREICIELK